MIQDRFNSSNDCEDVWKTAKCTRVIVLMIRVVNKNKEKSMVDEYRFVQLKEREREVVQE